MVPARSTSRSSKRGSSASNDTNQPQVSHTSTCECTDRACLIARFVDQFGMGESAAESLEYTKVSRPAVSFYHSPHPTTSPGSRCA